MTGAVKHNHAKHRHVVARIMLAGALLFGGAVTATVIGGSTPVWAQSAVTLYVASGGSGDCTSHVDACGSLATALTTATGASYSDDDVTIDVGAGTFDENDIVDAAGLNSLTIDGAGRSSTILDGTESGNVLVISGGTVTISGLAVENGAGGDDGAGIDSCDGLAGCVLTVSGVAFTDDVAPAWGGAIDNGDNGGDGTLNVTDSTFIDDTSSGNGGGAINNGANGGSGIVTVSGSTFTGDAAVASGRGGAIDNADNSGAGTVTVSGSTFTDDTADWGGGAIDNGSDQGDGSVSVANSTFSSNGVDLSNSASSGGAIDNGDGSATVSDSTFSNNEANYGGAINGSDNAYEGGSGSLTVSGSTFSANSAIDGGAIDGADSEGRGAGSAGDLTVSDSTFSGNTAASDGGAIDNADNTGAGDTTVTSSTFSGNGASITGGTVDNAGNGGTGNASFGASILAGSTAGGECAGTITDLGYNIDDGNTCGLAAPSLSDTSADLDPTGLQANGGPTQTIALEPGSPAISLVANAPQCPATDQRGAARPTSGACDAGAYDTNGTSFDPSVSSVAVGGTLASPTLTVTGSGFGNEADLGAPVPATGCSNTNTGSDYDNFTFTDVNVGWNAGGGGNCIGVTVSTYSDNQITLAFGNGYGNGSNQYGLLSYGDSFQMSVLGVAYNGTVPYPTTPVIDGVTFGGDPTNPTVTVSGSGFGTLFDLGTANAAGCSGTGFDYGNNLYFADVSAATPWQAGQTIDCLGIANLTYTSTQITFNFGDLYSVFGPVNDGDRFSLTLFGTTFNGTASLGTGYSCTITGDSGTTSFPVVMSESPAPPATIDAGGTFSTALAAQVTIPASVINHFIGTGATSLTVASQTSAEDGLSSVGGSASGAVSPNTESATADNLPQSDTTLVAGTPYTYDTAYNPVTWQTGPGTGAVYFVPGAIDAEVTFVVHNTPTGESLTCNPPSGVAALGTTTVKAPPPTPTFQVPSSTPALQNQVSAGTDGGWAATVTNTSTATVDGLTATVSVSAGGHPLTYDLAGMSASGTSCSTDGSGKVTCSIGTLAEGAADTLNLLVNTTGLANGTTITGSASVTSSKAGTHVTTLGGVGVVVVESGNGTEAVAAPGIALASTKRTLKQAKAKVTLTLPKAKIKVAKKSANDHPITPWLAPLASATVTENPPPVAVTLKSLAPSAEPALCPPTGSTRCEGNIIEAYGNFGVYTSNLAPIQAVIQFFYGSTIPSGTVYFLKPNGKTVDKLAACKRTSAGYDTPCLATNEKDLGTTGNKYVQDTVYFTGNDPIMGRR